MNLKDFSDSVLHLNTKASALRERLATTELLHHLLEVQNRGLFSQHGCSSLFDYCVRVLKMSEAHASRRIGAMRVLKDCPEVECKIKSGQLSVTALSQAQTFFRKEAQCGQAVSVEEKTALLEELESKPTREVERILTSKSSVPEKMIRETVRAFSKSLTEVKLVLDESTHSNLNRLKEIWSHEMPHASFSDLVKKMATLALQKCDPDLKAARCEKRAARKKSQPTANLESLQPNPTPAPESASENHIENKNKTEMPLRSASLRTRYIPATIRHKVWLRDGGTCTFEDAASGIRCQSRHFLQLDHIVPFAKGGEHQESNLRIRCFTHNELH